MGNTLIDELLAKRVGCTARWPALVFVLLSIVACNEHPEVAVNYNREVIDLNTVKHSITRGSEKLILIAPSFWRLTRIDEATEGFELSFKTESSDVRVIKFLYDFPKDGIFIQGFERNVSVKMTSPGVFAVTDHRG